MYKGSQDLRDSRTRVGSHATKLHPARGDLGPNKGMKTRKPEIPDEDDLVGRELWEERARLVKTKEELCASPPCRGRSAEILRLQGRLSEINAELRTRAQTRGGFGTYLMDAMNEVLDHDLVESIITRARALRSDRRRNYVVNPVEPRR